MSGSILDNFIIEIRKNILNPSIQSSHPISEEKVVLLSELIALTSYGEVLAKTAHFSPPPHKLLRSNFDHLLAPVDLHRLEEITLKINCVTIA